MRPDRVATGVVSYVVWRPMPWPEILDPGLGRAGRGRWNDREDALAAVVYEPAPVTSGASLLGEPFTGHAGGVRIG